VAHIDDWAGLVAYLQAHHRGVQTFPGDRLRFGYDHEGVEYAIGAQVLLSATRAPWISFATKLCPVEQFRTRSALVANVDLPIGGLAIAGDHAVLRQSLPLRGLAEADLEHALRALVTFAAQLRAVAVAEDVDIDTPYAYLFA